MSILDKLFTNKATHQSSSLVSANSTIAAQNKILAIHPDLQNLLWIADGPKKNYIPQNNDRVFEYNGIRITFSSFSDQEPSLISSQLPIQENVDPQQIERPPYFPSYAGLTVAQRGIYWKLLANPYSGQFNIGYPELFYKELIGAMQSGFGTNGLEISKFITQAEWQRLHKQAVPIFANVSIRDKFIDVPLISDCIKLKKAAYDLLEQAHESVKKELAQMRKDGTLPPEKKSKPTKVIESLSFDNAQEKELLRQYKSAQSNTMDRHFALIALQDFYYKYRDLDSKYLQLCIDYCNEDITLLPQVQSQYVREERANLQKLAPLYSKYELAKRLSDIHAFNGNIPAFKRLAIISEKSKDYTSAIDICNQAIRYYASVDMHNAVAEFEQRKQKMEAKILTTHDVY